MYAIDRKAIVEQLYGGGATVVPCLFNNPLYQPTDVNAYAADPAKAQALLKDANWDQIKGDPIEILTYYSDQLSNNVLVTIQQMLAAVGIDVTVRAVDGPTFTQTVDGGNGTGWSIDYAGLLNGPDPDATSIYYISTSVPPNGGNESFVNIPELDHLYAQGQTETDPAKRAQIYQQVCKVFNDQIPNAWMWVAQRFGGVSTRAGNFIWTPAPSGGRYYDAAETWTISS